MPFSDSMLSDVIEPSRFWNLIDYAVLKRDEIRRFELELKEWSFQLLRGFFSFKIGTLELSIIKLFKGTSSSEVIGRIYK